MFVHVIRVCGQRNHTNPTWPSQRKRQYLDWAISQNYEKEKKLLDFLQCPQEVVRKTISSFNSLPAPFIPLTWVLLRVVSLHLTNQILPWILPTNYVSAVKSKTTLLSAFRHLCDPRPPPTPPALRPVLLCRISSSSSITAGQGGRVYSTHSFLTCLNITLPWWSLTFEQTFSFFMFT